MIISKGQAVQLEVGDYDIHQHLIPIKIVKPYNEHNSIVEFEYVAYNSLTQLVIPNAEINFKSFL